MGGRRLSSVQLSQSRLDEVERGKLERRRRLFGVTDDAFPVDDKGGPCGGCTYAYQIGKQHVIGFRNIFVKVARERDRDVLLLSPRFLSERTVHTDGDHLGIKVRVGFESARDIAHFLGANAGESQRKEQQHRIAVADVVGELDVLEALGRLGLESEVGCLGTGWNSHNVLTIGLKRKEMDGPSKLDLLTKLCIL